MVRGQNGFWRQAGVIVAILIAVLAAAVGYGVLTARVEGNCASIATLEPKVAAHDSALGRVEVKQELTLKAMERVEIKLERIENRLNGP